MSKVMLISHLCSKPVDTPTGNPTLNRAHLHAIPNLIPCIPFQPRERGHPKKNKSNPLLSHLEMSMPHLFHLAPQVLAQLL